MERAVVECVLGREDMIIVAIITFLVVVGIEWAICASIPHDPAEDEEQEKYLKEWREKHKK